MVFRQKLTKITLTTVRKIKISKLARNFSSMSSPRAGGSVKLRGEKYVGEKKNQLRHGCSIKIA